MEWSHNLGMLDDIFIVIQLKIQTRRSSTKPALMNYCTATILKLKCTARFCIQFLHSIFFLFFFSIFNFCLFEIEQKLPAKTFLGIID